MIIEQTKEFFESFTKPYMKDSDESRHEKYDIKYHHPYRVANICVDLAESLSLSDRDREMAYVIGLLHDVGRFVQIEKYDSFSDLKTEDHGDLGEELVRNLDFLKEHYSEEDLGIICLAVNCHSKRQLSDNIKEKRARLFCQLVRDADKIDISGLYAGDLRVEKYAAKIAQDSQERTISDETREASIQHRLVDRQFISSASDEIFSVMSFVFDLNYKRSFQIYKERQYLEKLFSAVEGVDGRENLEKRYMAYLEKGCE